MLAIISSFPNKAHASAENPSEPDSVVVCIPFMVPFPLLCQTCLLLALQMSCVFSSVVLDWAQQQIPEPYFRPTDSETEVWDFRWLIGVEVWEPLHCILRSPAVPQTCLWKVCSSLERSSFSLIHHASSCLPLQTLMFPIFLAMLGRSFSYFFLLSSPAPRLREHRSLP